MDQLKTFGVWMKKNYFWVCCGLVTLMSLAVWWVSTSTLASETSDREKQLKDKEQAGQTIASTQNHPNPAMHSKMEEINLALVDDVYDAWQQQYDKQRTILTWPGLLGPEFLSIVSKLQPIEAKIKFPPEREELNLTQRTQYRDFIYVELPKLAKIIGADWAGSRSNSVVTAAEPIKPPLVVWSSGDQSLLQQSRFNWGGKIPTTLDVLYAQEDLWVLRSIMEIVKAANGDIEFRYQATVKTIEYIDIGRAAIGLGGSVGAGGGGGSMEPGGLGMGKGGGESDGPGSMGGGFPSSGMGGMGMGGMGMGGMGSLAAGGGAGSLGGEMAGGGMAETAQAVDPGDNRYVDLKYAPLTAQQIRSAYDSASPEDAFLLVAKRIPVRMRLKVDQRKLPKLLAECGNASLQLEIKQVRINRPAFRTGGGGIGGGGGGGGLMGGMGMGGMGKEGGMGGMGGVGPPGEPGGLSGGGSATGDGDGGAAMPSGPDGAGAGGLMGGMGAGGMMGGGMMSGGQRQVLSDETPYDLDVELYGIIYIYNPVNREKLGKKLEEPVTTEPEADPAATPPPAEAAG